MYSFGVLVQKIALTNSDIFALVDDEDAVAVVLIGNWQYINGYVIRNKIKLHDFIANRMGLIGQVDHKNRIRHDNQRHNIRIATQGQNLANKPKMNYKSTTSPFKGVHRHGCKWRTRLYVKGQLYELGSFNSEIDAAKAYNKAAVRYYGEFALLNEV